MPPRKEAAIAVTVLSFLQEADDEYWAATDPSLEGATGRYFVNRQQRKSASQSYDMAAQQQLWKLLEHQTDSVFPVPGSR
jgi:hypothetical protein